MRALTEQQWRWLGVGGVLGLCLYRVLVVIWGYVPVDIEEAYYLSWTERPEWGYFSKPPLLPALLAGVTAVFSDAPAVFKSLAVLLYSGAALLVGALARTLFRDERTAAFSALSFALMPLVSGLSMFVSTDAPLFLFWVLALYAFVRALRSNAWGWWVLVGIAGGLGMLSKYTMGILALGLLGYLLSSGQWRVLLTPRLWLGVLIAVSIWLPNLLWQASHEFITFTHTKHISGVAQAGLNWTDLRDFLLSQIGIFGPILAVVMLLGMRRRMFWRGDSRAILLWASLPMLLVIALQALSSEANINWAGPAYIGLVIVVVDWMLRADWQKGVRWLQASLVLNLLLVLIVYHYHALAGAFDIALTRKTDPYFKRLGWEGVADQLRPLRERYPQAPLVSAERKLLALLGYHTRDIEPVVRRSWNPVQGWHSQYDLYNNLADHSDDEVLLLSSTLLPPETLSRFEQVATPMTLTEYVYADLQVTVYVYWAKGFKGYTP